MTTTEMPAQPSFREHLATAAANLTRSESLVAEWVRAHPETVIVSTAARLGRLTSTSDATVLRTVKALGYRGLRDLQTQLLDELQRHTDLTTQLSHWVEAMAPGGSPGRGNALERVRHDSLQVMRDLPTRIPPQAWESAVRAVADAASVLCFGLGPAGLVAQHLALGLVRVGKPAAGVAMSGVGLADALSSVTAETAVVVVAPLRMFREITTALDHARSAGAATVVVTESLAHDLRGRADTILVTPPTVHGTANAALPSLGVAQALCMELAARQPRAAMEKTRQLEQLREQIVGGPLR